MSIKSLVICEWGKIHRGLENKANSIDSITLKDVEWDSLAEIKDPKYFQYVKKDQIQIKGFVGVITTSAGTQIEILPKIDEGNDEASVRQSRLILERMLKTVNNIKCPESTQADLLTKKAPLQELLISWFLTEVNKLIKKGIRQDYNRVEATEKFLKGQLQLSSQLRKPAYKQHTFDIEYDVFSADRAENRLIHSALIAVSKWSKDYENQKRAKHFLLTLDGVPTSSGYTDDFSKWSVARDMRHYQSVLPWIKLILNQQSPFSIAGKYEGISFLLPMNELFEKYVAKRLSTQLPRGYRLTEQKPQKALVNTERNEGAFQMKPDIAIHYGKEDKPICILDTKWKRIDQEKTYDSGSEDKKRGISQSDMYQLFAYGKKYNVKTVALIYPKWSGFDSAMTFKFDEELTLLVIPFELSAGCLSGYELNYGATLANGVVSLNCLQFFFFRI